MSNLEVYTPNPWVVIDGVDYSGKTTLSKDLANVLGGKVVRPIPPELSQVRSIIEEYCDKNERYSFFVASSLLTYERIKGVLIKKSPVITDRWIYSTNIHHELLGVDPNLFLPEDQIPKSEFMFFTTTSYGSWLKRKEERNEIGVDDDLITEDFMLQVNAFLKSQGLIEINTDLMSVRDSTDFILGYIRAYHRDFSKGMFFNV